MHFLHLSVHVAFHNNIDPGRRVKTKHEEHREAVESVAVPCRFHKDYHKDLSFVTNVCRQNEKIDRQDTFFHKFVHLAPQTKGRFRAKSISANPEFAKSLESQFASER